MAPYFNYDMVLLARQLRRKNQNELAKAVSIAQGQLSKIENGITEPNESVIAKIAEYLCLPIEFFYQPDRIYGLPISMHHRKKSSVAQHSLESIHAELNIRVMHLRKLLQSTKISPQFIMPKVDIDDCGGDPEKVADIVRRTWLLPPGPVKNITECIEQAGGVVIWCDFCNVPVDGVSYFSLPDLPPCIFLNHSQPADRMRFTIAHELGHIVMHRMPTNHMEEEANAFASSFLMPAKDIRGSLTNRATLQSLSVLKPYWRVSIQALIKRASDLNLLTYNQSRYLWQQINANRIRFHEPPELDFAHEDPVVLQTIFELHMEKLGYTIEDIAKFVKMYKSDLLAWYPFLVNPNTSTNRRGSLYLVNK